MVVQKRKLIFIHFLFFILCECTYSQSMLASFKLLNDTISINDSVSVQVINESKDTVYCSFSLYSQCSDNKYCLYLENTELLKKPLPFYDKCRLGTVLVPVDSNSTKIIKFFIGQPYMAKFDSTMNRLIHFPNEKIMIGNFLLVIRYGKRSDFGNHSVILPFYRRKIG